MSEKIFRVGDPEAPAGAFFLRPEQEASVRRMMAEPTHAVCNASEMDTGKAQPLDSLVLTPTGFVRMGDIAMGQEVVSPDGSVTHVTGIFPQGERDVYELTLVDGRTVRADADHLWSVSTYGSRWRGKKVETKTTTQLLETLHMKNGDSRWSIETVAPADLGEWSSSIAPYLLGSILGDGGITTDSVMFSTADWESLLQLGLLLPDGVRVRKASGSYDYRFSTGIGGLWRNPVTAELRRLGLMGHGAWTKFVPSQLLYSSAGDRLSLLQGLLDTDGTPDHSGFAFLSASPQLADDVVWLVRSLGGRATITTKMVDGKCFQRIWGKLPLGVAPFRLRRKLARMTPATKYPITHLAIRDIQFIGREQTQCIMVESDLHEYVTDNFIRTHNTAITAEFVVRMGFTRVMYAGIRDTFDQWASRLAAQSDGAIRLLRIDSTKQGQANFAALLAGEPGHFFVGAQYLTSKDWHYEDKRDQTGALVYVKDKKTGLPTDKVEKIRYHDFVYKKMRPLDLMVFDEVHMVANRKSLGARTLKTIPTDWKIALSGTWVGNRFENAQTVAGWLWPTLIDPNASRWRAEWCATKTQYVKGGKGVDVVTGEKEPGKFVSTLPCYIRLESEVKVPDPEVVVVPLLPQQRADYEALEEDGLVWLQAHPNLEPLVTSLPITKRLRLRQVTLGVVSWTHDGKIDFAYDTQSTKLYALRGVLDRPEWTGRQVGIYVNSKKFVKVVVARMRAAGYNAVEWSGDISSKRREGIKKAWLAGEISYLVSVIRSFSTGLDEYQFVCNRVVWLAEDDNNTANQQAIKRYCRTGDPVMLADFRHVKIVAEDTLDAGIHFGNIAKTERMRATIGIAA